MLLLITKTYVDNDADVSLYDIPDELNLTPDEWELLREFDDLVLNGETVELRGNTYDEIDYCIHDVLRDLGAKSVEPDETFHTYVY